MIDKGFIGERNNMSIRMKRFHFFLDEVKAKELEEVAKDHGIDRGSMGRVLIIQGIRIYLKKKNAQNN